MTAFVEDDGGRAAAGYKGFTGDCVARAITIATGKPYAEVYDALFERSKAWLATTRSAKRLTRSGKPRSASPRDGQFREVYEPYLLSLGWTWVPTMAIGSGTTVHLTADELPPGRIIVRLSRHVATVIDGVLHDTYDSSRDGTRAVYGYYHQ